MFSLPEKQESKWGVGLLKILIEEKMINPLVVKKK